MKKQYRVTAGKVTVETAVGPGRALIDIFQGNILPADVPQEQIDTELRLGTIEEVMAEKSAPSTTDSDGSTDDGANVPPPSTEELVPPELPQGMSVPTTLEWVNAVPEEVHDRAEVALNAETGAGGKNRSTLIEQLQEIFEATMPEGEGTDEGAGAGA